MAELEERRRDATPPEGGLSLLDGVSPVASTLPADMAAERLVAADKERPLVIYCYHGHSSEHLAQLFGGCAFRNAYSVAGGFDSWKKAGH